MPSDPAFPPLYILVLSSMVSVFRLGVQPAQVDGAFPREVKRNNGKLSSVGRSTKIDEACSGLRNSMIKAINNTYSREMMRIL